MPHFDEFGGDEWVCQICGKIKDSHTKLVRQKGIGNVCPACMVRHFDEVPMGLVEHCHSESGGMTGAALQRYINRYYGHG